MKTALAAGLAFLFLALPLGGHAQRMPRVGILWISERSMLGDRHGAFEQAFASWAGHSAWRSLNRYSRRPMRSLN